MKEIIAMIITHQQPKALLLGTKMNMKKIALALVSLLAASIVFAQTDLQVLAVVKLTKNDSITVKLLKNRVESYEKTQNGVKLSLADREKVLEAMIQEKVVLQAATKAGISIPDSTVEQYFMQSISQQVGRQISEAEFEQIVQEQTKMSLDEYMKQMTGMSVSDYKAYLKNQLIVQQYIISQKQNELNSVGPTDEEIRAAYELNKANYVWSDMLKMYLVIVPKATDAEKARIKINDLYKKFKDKKLTTAQLSVDSKKENSGFQSGEVLVNKTSQSAMQLGISYSDLLSLFEKEKNFISEIAETESSFQFYTILKKYDAKMLSLSDVVQPETTVTVYDFIKSNLAQQKQMEYLSKAASDIAKELDTPENVERKKTGDALQKLLNW